MGLDQYAYEVVEDEKQEIAYWRKHNRLQGWMENLWRQKGGEGEFNCVDVELTLGDLDALESAINNKTMPETTGFFFGSDSYEDYEEWYKPTDEKFILESRAILQSGGKVVYSSWW